MASPDPQPTADLQKPPRFHGFDALRGGAMLLGILLHAAITYMVRPMQGLLWPLRDQPKDFSFDLLFWWIHGWRIPLFFVMAGFFAAMLARRRGPRGFIKHRIERILIPVLVASVTLLTAMYYIWGWGWQLEGYVRWEEVWQFDFDTPYYEDRFMTPAHLWFLNYLFIYSCVYWLILKLTKNTPQSDEPTLGPIATRLFKTPLRPLLFAVPTFVMLAINPDFYLGYHHVIPLSVDEWLQESAQIVYQGWFFVVGVYLFRLHRDMEPIKRFAWLYLSLGTVVFTLVYGLMRAIEQAEGSGGVAWWVKPIHAATIALFCWLMIWGLTGLGLTILAKPRAVVRWLSDSAYWVYLVHLPIVALLMIVMRNWPIGPWGRFLIIVSVTSVLTLVSYQYLVRYTFIGRWLNGPRVKKPSGD